ncbi:MAG: hypothetical protein ACXVPU_04745 [Bacteroidia bacterium]
MFRVLEIFWLVVGLVAIIMSSYSIITKDSKSALYFIVITFASGLMYAMRKRQRVKFEQAEKEREKKK